MYIYALKYEPLNTKERVSGEARAEQMYCSFYLTPSLAHGNV